MAIYFNAVLQGNPSDPTAPQKYYARAAKTKELDLRTLVKEISYSTTATPSDVMAILESLLEQIPKYLMDGKRVHLGDFGSFRVTLTSRGEDTEEAVSRHSIKSVRVQFNPGKELTGRFALAKFEKNI